KRDGTRRWNLEEGRQPAARTLPVSLHRRWAVAERSTERRCRAEPLRWTRLHPRGGPATCRLAGGGRSAFLARLSPVGRPSALMVGDTVACCSGGSMACAQRAFFPLLIQPRACYERERGGGDYMARRKVKSAPGRNLIVTARVQGR